MIFKSWYFAASSSSLKRSLEQEAPKYHVLNIIFIIIFQCRFYVDSHGDGVGNVIFFFRSDSRLNIYDDDIIILSGKGAGPTIPLPFPIKKTSQLHILIHFSLPPSIYWYDLFKSLLNSSAIIFFYIQTSK